MIRKFETTDEEILTILAEECAELIQEIMKMKRQDHYRSVTFESEVGDVICLLQLAEEYEIFNKDAAARRAADKRTKLKKWSRIFDSSVDIIV